MRASLGTDPARGPEQVDDLVRCAQRYTTGASVPWPRRSSPTASSSRAPRPCSTDYDDRPGQRGEPRFSEAALNALVLRLAEEDFNVHVHAIGDRAVRMTLDAFEAARQASADRGLRHQIAHLEVIEPADVPRFRKLGVIANFQPLWAYADAYIAISPGRPSGPRARAGSTRSGPGAVRRRAGVRQRLVGVVAEPARGDPGRDHAPGHRGRGAHEPLVPEQAIDLPTGLAGYTIGSAYANRFEKETGSIEVGKAADLMVISGNLFEPAPHEIAKARVLLTLLEGQAVYRDPSLAF